MFSIQVFEENVKRIYGLFLIHNPQIIKIKP